MNMIEENLNRVKQTLDHKQRRTISTSQQPDIQEFVFFEPASTEEIQAFCEKNQVTLPPDYLSFLQLHNGFEIRHYADEMDEYPYAIEWRNFHTLAQIQSFIDTNLSPTVEYYFTFPTHMIPIASIDTEGIECIFIDLNRMKEAPHQYINIITSYSCCIDEEPEITELPLNFKTWFVQFIDDRINKKS